MLDFKKSKRGIIPLYLVFLLCAAILVWFSQSSIEHYWQQKYHQESPLAKLNQYTLWTKGQHLQHYLQQRYAESMEKLTALFYTGEEKELSDVNSVVNNEEDSNTDILPEQLQPDLSKSTDFNEVENNDTVELLLPSTDYQTPFIDYLTQRQAKLEPFQYLQRSPLFSDPMKYFNRKKYDLTEASAVIILYTKLYQQFLNEQQEAINSKAVSSTEEMLTEQAQVGTSDQQEDKRIALSQGDKVFFAGDSLMQGIAPHIQKILKQQHNINSINLSKQSTGLSYPSAFDWPKTIENTLKKDDKIKLLVVFLGPNDPWDMPDPRGKGRPYLKFKSAEWENVYRSRIQHIVQIAAQYDVKVIWLGIPYMRAKKLNEQTRYLESLLADELSDKILWLPTTERLSLDGLHYSEIVEIDNKRIKVRSKDGIHFSLAGQKLLAEYVLQHIKINQEDEIAQ